MRKPSAAKRGRDPRFPYVPVIIHDGVLSDGRHHHHTEQVRGFAYATREEALAMARITIAVRDKHDAAVAARSFAVAP
jgi:hypothetical protein